MVIEWMNLIGDKQIITLSEYETFRKPDSVINPDKETGQTTGRMANLKGVSVSDAVYLQITTDTLSFESLYLTLWDLLFNPMTPNALALAELKMHGHLIRYDLYGGIPDSYIVDNDLNKPYRNPNPPTNLYIFGTNEMRERAIPFLISDYHTIIVASPKDVGLFWKFFWEFECSRAFNDKYANMNMWTLLSISGYSIFNKYDRLMR